MLVCLCPQPFAMLWQGPHLLACMLQWALPCAQHLAAGLTDQVHDTSA